MKPIIAVKDQQGNVYTMPSDTETCILEVHYSTAYFQFIVQDVRIGENAETIYPEKNIIVPLNKELWVDFIAVDDSELGELVSV